MLQMCEKKKIRVAIFGGCLGSILMSWRDERKRSRENYHCDTNAMHYSSKQAAVSAATFHIACILRGYTAILKYLLLMTCLHRMVKPARCSSYLQMPGADTA